MLNDDILDEGIKYNSKKDAESAKEILNLKKQYLKEEKDVRNGKIALWGIVILQFIAALVEHNQFQDTTVNTINAIIIGVIALSAIFAEKNPFLGFVIGFSIFCLFQLIVCIADPMNIIRGIVVKVFIFYYLIVGISSARSFIKTKESLAFYGLNY